MEASNLAVATFSNLTSLDAREESVCIFEQWHSVLAYAVYMFLCTYEHIQNQF